MEVHNNETGLAGCWFPGRVIALHAGQGPKRAGGGGGADPRACWALVEYEELRTSADEGACDVQVRASAAPRRSCRGCQPAAAW